MAGNAFANEVTSNESYTINAALAPTATIKRSNPTFERVNRLDVTFEVEFSETVQGVDVSDFVLSSNSVTANIAGFQEVSASKYQIQVDGIGNSGLIDLDIVSSSNIQTQVRTCL